MAHHQKTGSFAKRIQHQKQQQGLTARVLLYFGLIILLFSMLYLLVNFTNTDSIISSWLPFMISGLALVVVSQLMLSKKSHTQALGNRKKK